MNKISRIPLLLCISFIFAAEAKHVGSSTYTLGGEYLIMNKSPKQSTESQSWVVVGDGPASIITIALLLEFGIAGENIFWIGPEFNVGRIGTLYTQVPSNTKTKLFIKLLNACKVFRECASPAIDKLYTYDPEKEYPLEIIVKPLQDITKHLMTKVNALRTTMTSLHFEDGSWKIGTASEHQLNGDYVILATGSRPRSLDYPCEVEIPLDIALDKIQLAKYVDSESRIAVVGSSHSAVLVMMFLSELNVKGIINFYKKPIRYAIDMGDWVLYNESGLAGIAARWAQQVLEKNPPPNLIRLYNCPESREAWLPVCNKIIYAVGFERNELPAIEGNECLEYDYTTGIIGPRLFGVGIAFPEVYIDPLGNKEARIGLLQFLDYLGRVVPQWMKRDIFMKFAEFEELFTIELL